eukprot:TRINITY_DN5987_c0_g1_i1.p1 TRINITY_DN5987_c0_g1~~TRINITY_DN5987_c0_g1_i1.p1  ORF type:complete len:403 (+),score=56.07 TRINITY_DN5987_c0_g1_i1:89-1210(+)
MCRSCFDADPLPDLIAPCACSGSAKYVHRGCLDQWRAVSMNPDAFWRCEVCHAPYRMLVQEENRSWARIKFGFYIGRDFLIVLLLLNLTICGMGALGNALWKGFETDIVQNIPQIAFLEKSIFIRLYCFGGVLTLFLLGIVGSFYFCYYKCCGGEQDRPAEARQHQSYDYRSTCGTSNVYFIWCGDPYYGSRLGPCSAGDNCVCCIGNSISRPHTHISSGASHSCGGNDCGSGNCSGGSCSGSGDNCSGDCGGGDGAAVLLVVALVVIIIVCLIGLFFGIFLATILGTRIVHRHLHVLARQNQSKVYVVADLSDPEQVRRADEEKARREEEGDTDPIMRQGGETASLIPQQDPLKKKVSLESESLLDSYDGGL